MFEVLPSSKQRGARQVGTVRAMMAAGLHLIVIAGAVRVTAGSTPAPSPRVADTFRFVIPQPQAEDPVAGTPDPSSFITPRPVIELPSVPDDPPIGLPPVLPGPALDPALFRKLVGADLGGGARGDSTDLTRILFLAEVEDPAEIVSQPSPRYPPVLQAAGIEGRVFLEFVIDTLGHPEPGSLRVTGSSNPGFDAPAREVIERSLFRPARVRGRPVRQLALQSILFHLTGR